MSLSPLDASKWVDQCEQAAYEKFGVTRKKEGALIVAISAIVLLGMIIAMCLAFTLGRSSSNSGTRFLSVTFGTLGGALVLPGSLMILGTGILVIVRAKAIEKQFYGPKKPLDLLEKETFKERLREIKSSTLLQYLVFKNLGPFVRNGVITVEQVRVLREIAKQSSQLYNEKSRISEPYKDQAVVRACEQASDSKYLEHKRRVSELDAVLEVLQKKWIEIRDEIVPPPSKNAPVDLHVMRGCHL